MTRRWQFIRKLAAAVWARQLDLAEAVLMYRAMDFAPPKGGQK